MFPPQSMIFHARRANDFVVWNDPETKFGRGKVEFHICCFRIINSVIAISRINWLTVNSVHRSRHSGVASQRAVRRPSSTALVEGVRGVTSEKGATLVPTVFLSTRVPSSTLLTQNGGHADTASTTSTCSLNIWTGLKEEILLSVRAPPKTS
jgi:hypothetical protein